MFHSRNKIPAITRCKFFSPLANNLTSSSERAAYAWKCTRACTHTHIYNCGWTHRWWNSLLNYMEPRLSLPATFGALSFPLLSVSCMEQTFDWNNCFRTIRESQYINACAPWAPAIIPWKQENTNTKEYWGFSIDQIIPKSESVNRLVLEDQSFITAFSRWQGSVWPEHGWPASDDWWDCHWQSLSLPIQGGLSYLPACSWMKHHLKYDI